MRKLLWVAVPALLWVGLAAAQDTTAVEAADSTRQAVVTRNVNLRPSPSTAGRSIRLLKPPDELELREDTATNRFYPVRTDEGEEGWVWSRNVRVASAPEQPVSPSIAPRIAAAQAAIAASIDESWSKPDPSRSSFTSQGRHCGASGDGGDKETNLRKNRTDLPSSYHDVTFDAIAKLPYPVGPKQREKWTAPQLAQLARFEGAALRVVGFLVALKPQTSGSGESTNCHWTASAEVDWHMALVGKVGEGEADAVVVETTPRLRRKHANWTPAALKPWVDGAAPIRVSGWLMFDPEHRNHLKKFRATLWEIHPITKLEVWRDSQFVDLDSLH